MKIKEPSSLKRGSVIAITCPSGFMATDKVQSCVRTLSDWGYKVKVGNRVGGGSENYFSGTDEERLNELQEMLDDKSIDAILFGRGGYGLSRIIDKISFKKFSRRPKWLIGFSDITILQMHIYRNYQISTMHAPMAAAFNDGEHSNEYIRSLHEALEGNKSSYACASHRYNRLGSATGRLIGGNLAMLAHACGTSSDFNSKNCILFLEDMGEYLYNADRMLYQLKRSGKFDKITGLIIGGFTDMKDTQRPFGKQIDEIISDVVAEYDFPVCYNFPVSHSRENVALKIGMKYNLLVKKDESLLVEI